MPEEGVLHLDLFPQRVSRWAREGLTSSWPPEVMTRPWGSERTGMSILEAVLDNELMRRVRMARALGYYYGATKASDQGRVGDPFWGRSFWRRWPGGGRGRFK